MLHKHTEVLLTDKVSEMQIPLTGLATGRSAHLHVLAYVEKYCHGSETRLHEQYTRV